LILSTSQIDSNKTPSSVGNDHQIIVLTFSISTWYSYQNILMVFKLHTYIIHRHSIFFLVFCPMNLLAVLKLTAVLFLTWYFIDISNFVFKMLDSWFLRVRNFFGLCMISVVLFEGAWESVISGVVDTNALVLLYVNLHLTADLSATYDYHVGFFFILDNPSHKAWKCNSKLLIYCYDDSWTILKMHNHNFFYTHLKFKCLQYLSNWKFTNYFVVENLKMYKKLNFYS